MRTHGSPRNRGPPTMNTLGTPVRDAKKCLLLPSCDASPDSRGVPSRRQPSGIRRLRRTIRAMAVLTTVAAVQETARLSQAVSNQWLLSQPRVTM